MPKSVLSANGLLWKGKNFMEKLERFKSKKQNILFFILLKDFAKENIRSPFK